MGNESFSINVTDKEVSMIVTSLKMYRAFEEVLDEEIECKYND